MIKLLNINNTLLNNLTISMTIYFLIR